MDNSKILADIHVIHLGLGFLQKHLVHVKVFGVPISTYVWGSRYYIKDFLNYMLAKLGVFSRSLILILVWVPLSLFCVQTLLLCCFPLQCSFTLALGSVFHTHSMPISCPELSYPSMGNTFMLSSNLQQEQITRSTHSHLLSLFSPIRFNQTLIIHVLCFWLDLELKVYGTRSWVAVDNQWSSHDAVKSILAQ